MRAKQLYSVQFVALVLLALPACGLEPSTRRLRIGHGLDPSHSVHRAMEYLAARMKEKSGGAIEVLVYPSQQLGTERECLELLQIGSLAMTKVSASVLESFVPVYRVFSLPYLFRDDDHKFDVFEGEVGRELLLATEPFRLRGLCFYDAGSRSFYTKERPILRPEDLEGLKIRTQESATSVKLVNLLGGSATPISWGELYTSLQQGVVDGAENNPPSFYLSRHYEVCKHYSLDEHTSVPDVLLISTLVWNRLSSQDQRWLQEAAFESYQHQKVLWKESSEEALAAVQEAGVTVYYPDKNRFLEKVQPLIEEYEEDEEMSDVIQEIRKKLE